MRKIVESDLLDSLSLKHFNNINKELVNPCKVSGRKYFNNSIYNKISEYAKTQIPVHKPFYDFLHNILKEIITSTPHRLLELHTEILEKWLQVDSCLSNLEVQFDSLLKNIFTYDTFRNGETDTSPNIKWFNSLNLKSCPYCNRNWVTIVKDSKNNNKLYF